MFLTHWLDSLMAPLKVVLFKFGQDAVTWAELLGFATGAVGVWLTVRFDIWNPRHQSASVFCAASSATGPTSAGLACAARRRAGPTG